MTFPSTGLSNVGGVPLTVVHGKYGPGLAFRYQLFRFRVGGERPDGGVELSTVA